MRYPDYLVHYNKNHDKRTGRFTFGDGNGDGVSPDDYRTPELDKTYSELEKSGVFKFNTIKPVGNTGDAEKEWGKEIVNATDVGIKALNKTRYKGEFNDYDLLDDVNKNGERHWFLFDDQTYGMPELAYLVNKGWSKDKIIDAFKTSSDLRDVNSKYEDAYLANKNVTFNDKNWYETYKEAEKSSPYKGIWNLAEGYDRMDYSNELDKYIDACIEISKEMKHSDEYADYLIHFNTRHDPKTGRFDFALPNEKMKPYGGQKKSEFAKSLKTTYESEGNSSLKSSRLTKYAIKSNKNETQQYNNNLRAFDLHKKKALKAYDKQDQKKYDREITKMLSAYRYAKIHEVASNDSVELGKMLYKSVAKELADSFVFGGAIGGAIKGGLDAVDDNNKLVKYYKDANKKVKAQMNMDYITKHPKEALEKLQIDTELDKRFGY